MEISGKCQHGFLWCISYRFSLIFFAKYDLFSLRNMRTKFCEAAPSRCKVVCCVAIRGKVQHGNSWCVSYWFSLIFFLLITIYLAYETCLRSFARLRSAFVELYGNCWKMSAWPFLVCFLLVFFNFFLLITIYLAYETCLQSFARLRSAVVKLCGNWWKMSAWLFLVRFLSVFFNFFC